MREDWPYDGHGPSLIAVDPKTVDATPRQVSEKQAILEPFMRDAWGTPIRFQHPGPVHTKGWDVWSCGPNLIDEQGHGDDLLVGDDISTETSSR